MSDHEARQLQDEVIEAAKSLERAYQLGALTDAEYRDGQRKVDAWRYEVEKRLGELPMTLANFELAVLQGASCDELVEIKTRMKKSPDYDEVSARLKAIGCYNRRSTRTDVPE